MTVGVALLGKETTIVGAPPLTGGVIAALLMKDDALAVGNDKLAVVAILVYVLQGFVGYPLTAILLKKEGRRLLAGYRKGEYESIIKVDEEEGNRKKLINFPEKYNTTYMILLRLAFVACIADVFTKFLNTSILHNPKAISPLVTCLIFGVIFAEIGLLDRKPLEKAYSFGWIMTTLMAFIFEDLNKATLALLLEVIGPLIGVIVIGVTGLIIFALIVGKIFKESKYISLPIALNALFGFPPNFILTTEAINTLTKDKDEVEYLNNIMMQKC